MRLRKYNNASKNDEKILQTESALTPRLYTPNDHYSNYVAKVTNGTERGDPSEL